jgi:hypothetical protein
VRPRNAATLVLAVSVFTAPSCGSQSRQQVALPRESIITSPKLPQAKSGTAACVAGCHIEDCTIRLPAVTSGASPR